MSTSIPSAPPAQYDQKWMYWYWAWSKHWLGTGAGKGTYAGAGDVLGTGTLGGTATYALSTTGVTAGTFGTGGTMIPRVVVDAKGRITGISNVGITFPTSTGGGFTIMAGDVLGTATGGTMVAQVGTIAGPFRVGTGTVNAIIDPTEVNGIMLNIINATGANGANIKLRGTGAAPSKFIRAAANRFEILNNAYGAVLFGMDDAGTATSVMMQMGTASAALGMFGTASAGLVSAGTMATPFGTFDTQKGTSFTMAGTGTAGRFNLALGSSTTYGNAPAVPYVDVNPVSLTTVAGTLMKYGVPANAMIGSGQGFFYDMWGTFQITLGNVRGALCFGTATLLVSTATHAAGRWRMEGNVAALSNSQQEYVTQLSITDAGGTSVSQMSVGTLGMNLSTVTTFCFVGTGTVANNVRTQRGMIINFFNGP